MNVLRAFLVVMLLVSTSAELPTKKSAASITKDYPQRQQKKSKKISAAGTTATLPTATTEVKVNTTESTRTDNNSSIDKSATNNHAATTTEIPEQEESTAAAKIIIINNGQRIDDQSNNNPQQGTMLSESTSHRKEQNSDNYCDDNVGPQCRSEYKQQKPADDIGGEKPSKSDNGNHNSDHLSPSSTMSTHQSNSSLQKTPTSTAIPLPTAGKNKKSDPQRKSAARKNEDANISNQKKDNKVIHADKAQLVYTHHHRHKDVLPYERVMSKDVPSHCPPLLQPHNIHYMVINMDQSVKRLQRMTDRFNQLGLPMFERIRGIEVKEGHTYDVRRITNRMLIADYGCALAHREAWKAAANGPHEWSLILEDDTQLISKELITDFPPVPADCDFVLLRPQTIKESEPVCKKTSVRWAHWGYGMIGYLVHREGAKRLIHKSDPGFNGPLDGHVWWYNQVCVTANQRVSHAPAKANDPHSIRQYLNGDANRYID